MRTACQIRGVAYSSEILSNHSFLSIATYNMPYMELLSHGALHSKELRNKSAAFDTSPRAADRTNMTIITMFTILNNVWHKLRR